MTEPPEDPDAWKVKATITAMCDRLVAAGDIEPGFEITVMRDAETGDLSAVIRARMMLPWPAGEPDLS
jgi:hypothetical protein